MSENDLEKTSAVERNPSWQWTSSELKRALDEWQELASSANGPSPDEKMLQDMQSLLRELKSKIDALSAD